MTHREILEIMKELVQNGELTKEEYALYSKDLDDNSKNDFDGNLEDSELEILKNTLSDKNVKVVLDFFKKYKDSLTGYRDLVGDNLVPDKVFFPIMIKYFGYLLSNNPEDIYSKFGVKARKVINPLVKAIGGSLLKNGQVIENRNYLLSEDSDKSLVQPDSEIVVPDKPVIWCFNHSGFKDDILASILAAKRHGYLFMASLPQFYNTLDGLTAWLNGVAIFNRKVKESRESFIPKASTVMNYGTDIYMAPEGIWNKTIDKPSLDLWRGIYVLACEKGAPVMPIVHYMRDKTGTIENNPIHTVLDDPVILYNLPEQAAINYLRDILATWYSLMMEKYGKSTKEEELKGYNCWQDAHMSNLEAGVKTVDRYDSEIEACGDYVPKQKAKDRLLCLIKDYLSIKNRDEESKKEWFNYIKELILQDEDFAGIKINSDQDLAYLVKDYIRVYDRPEVAFGDIAKLYSNYKNVWDVVNSSSVVRQRKLDNTQRRI